MQDLVFRSRIDVLIGLALLGAPIACGFSVGVDFVHELRAAQTSYATLGLYAGVLALGAVFPLWVLVSTRYVLRSDRLDVHSGPLHWRIALREIERALPSHAAWSSPALSLERIRIDYGRGRSIMISPRDRAMFLRELDARRAVLAR